MSRHSRVGFIDGLEGEERAVLPGYDTGVMGLLIGIFMLLAFSASHYSTFVKTFRQNLFSVRRRANVFDEHTMSETGIMISLVVLACVCEGIMIYFGANGSGTATPGSPFLSIILYAGLAFLMLFGQWVSYLTVGYAFTDYSNTSQWLKGFFASQALLGVSLTVPALWLLFNPGASFIMIPIAIGLYLSARVVFIYKGFRIFYTNFFSLVYFILYLCTLEIVPLAVLMRSVHYATSYYH